MVHEKKCKNVNSSHKVPTFWEKLIKWKMQHLHAYFTNVTLQINGDINGFLLYIGNVFDNLNAI
jgi:hypothetical protein